MNRVSEEGICNARPTDQEHPATIAPISAIIPTLDRPGVLKTVFSNLISQTIIPEEIIVIDASANSATEELCNQYRPLYAGEILYQKATFCGAAIQRNQGVSLSTQPYILFMDDDIEFGFDCVEKLWIFLNKDAEKTWGGVNAMITNQKYFPPGRVSRSLFRFMCGKDLPSYAGQCIGPVVTLLPQDGPDLPEYSEVGWLNTTCTLYRKEALPTGPFDTHFVGYSLMEDVDLSLRVRKCWKLANARTARIFHNSQPGRHKEDLRALHRMELVNRHYVMTRTLGRQSIRDYVKLAVFELFTLLTPLASGLRPWVQLPNALLGKVQGIYDLHRRN